MRLNIKFFHGFWALVRKIGIKMTQLTPLYILVFIAYGDLFLPKPLSNVSYNTRTTIIKFLTGAVSEDTIKNDKYNNKKIDQVIEETEKQYKGSEKK